MKKSLPKIALAALLSCSLIMGALSDTIERPTWTLDEKPQKMVKPLEANKLIDVPQPLRKLFPVLNNIEREVSFGQERGDANALLKAVKDLTQAEYFTGISGAGGSSDKLLEEATELAWQQRDPEALRESLVLWSSPSRAGRNRDKVVQTSERLEQVEKERAEMLTKERCRVIFHNRTERPVKVFVNRKPVGTLAAGERHTVGELLAGRQYLGANDSSLQWGPRKVYVGPGESFNWRLFD